MFSDLLFPIIYGLVIFLAGMKLMETALSKLAGPLLTTSLNRATSTPIKGMIASSLLSALLQSSTAVTVLTIGMVNAGLLTYARTLGIILGSNIGTTLTTELIGLQINTMATPCWQPRSVCGQRQLLQANCRLHREWQSSATKYPRHCNLSVWLYQASPSSYGGSLSCSLSAEHFRKVAYSSGS